MFKVLDKANIAKSYRVLKLSDGYVGALSASIFA